MSTSAAVPDNTIDDEAAARLARRPWPTIPIRSDIAVSFEFFPPPSATATATLATCAGELASLRPSFVSVTYGAGGTTRDRTLAAIDQLASNTDLEVAGHLTCVGASVPQVQDVIDTYVASGVRRIVALRGDAPEGTDDGTVADGYRDAAALVAAIRGRPDAETFDISVAAYPEVHPRAASAEADLDNLKRKIDAGADRAITQFFFDTDVFLRFLERARQAGITAPIVPGIMPVTNFSRLSQFAARCGTAIPAWMPELFDGLDDAPEIRRLVAATVAAEQCRRLAEHGVRSFHFYTMNQAELTAATCRILGLRPNAAVNESAA